MHPSKWGLDQIPSPALVVDAHSSIVSANVHGEELFGYARGDLARRGFEELVPSRRRTEWEQFLAAAFADPPTAGQARCLELPVVTSDGLELPVELGIGPCARETCALVLVADLSGSQRLPPALRESERHLRIGLLHTTNLVQYVNLEKDSLDWYGDLDSIMGYGPGEFPHTLSGWAELIHPEDQDRIVAEMDRIIDANGEGWHFRYRLRTKDGSYRYILDRGSFVNHVDGRPNEGIGGIVDETEHVVDREELEEALSRVADLTRRLRAESHYLQTEIVSAHGFDEIIGSSQVLSDVLGLVESVAQTDATVLLLGETGTGKELLARSIHRRSPRKSRPLIKVDCGTLPAGLVESELFGHEKGAFTGALDRKIGHFELAHEGTIFLDEIGELPLDLQSKLLRVIEEGEFRRVGGKTDKTVDVRVIAATNRNLRESLREGRFRSDLYYRLSVFPIEAPPLRERPEDVPKMVLFFTAKYAASLGKSVRNVAQGSMDALIAYDWPGNVRELRNVIERSMILSKGDTLTVDPALLGNAPSAPISSGPLKHDLQAVERARILRGLEESGWKIKGERNAASVLGITPSSLRSRMKKLGIVRPTLPQGDAGSEATGAI